MKAIRDDKVGFSLGCHGILLKRFYGENRQHQQDGLYEIYSIQFYIMYAIPF
jgi:hypothetical protein